MSALLDSRLDDDVKVSLREVQAILRLRGDTAYVNGCRENKREECLGEDFKLNNGIYSAKELAAHRKVAEYFGAYRALHAAADALAALERKQ